MQVIIAEKPSVAREIAAIVGATNRKDGFIEGNGYAVTWAFGHLVGLAMPQQYGIAGFRRENLPILPSSFILLPRQVREGKEYKADPGVVKQLGILRELFGMAERIIVATDAGREGELIFRYIYSYLECRTPFVRLWISSLTDRAIREGLQHLRPGNEYDNLYLSAKARSEADWIVGINASQALAVAAGRGVWSLGRVQTPTLAIICSRYLENKAFKPATYFRLKLSTAKEGTEFTVLSTEKFDGREKAEAARAAIIETLFAREYVRREKKSLVPTDKGLAVYAVVRDKKIADVAMTGGWELALSKIATGEMDAPTFHRGIEVFASQIAKELLEARIDGAESDTACPRCGRPVVFYPKLAKCQNPDCGLTVWRTVARKELTDKQLAELLTKGKTGTIRGFVKNGGGTFDAALTLDDQFKTSFVFEPRDTPRQGKRNKRK